MTPPDEALRKMAQGIARHEGIRPISAKRDATYLAYEGHVQAALAAADDAGWLLVPKHMPSKTRDAQAKRWGLSADIVHDIYDTSVARLAVAPKVTP